MIGSISTGANSQFTDHFVGDNHHPAVEGMIHSLKKRVAVACSSVAVYKLEMRFHSFVVATDIQLHRKRATAHEFNSLFWEKSASIATDVLKFDMILIITAL